MWYEKVKKRYKWTRTGTGVRTRKKTIRLSLFANHLQFKRTYKLLKPIIEFNNVVHKYQYAKIFNIPFH